MPPPEPFRAAAILHVATEVVLQRDPDGRLWSSHTIGPDQWAGHLAAFDSIRIVARVTDAPAAAAHALAFDHDRVVVVPLPAYKGLAGFLKVSGRLARAVWTESAHVGLALLQLPGPIGSILGLCLVVRRGRYAVQLVGDIDAVFATGDFPLPTRLTQLPLTLLTRYLCRTAKVISYVTRRTLQRRYPCSDSTAQFAFSNVQLERSAFATGARRSGPDVPSRILFCGSLAQRYKGLDVLIGAVRLLRDRDVRVQVTVVGDGRFRAGMAQTAIDLGVAAQMLFVGEVAHSRVLALLEDADLFVLPSRTEGLPRALVEAMAKGLPCIASRVGGVAELLSEEAMVPPDDPAALANAIERFVRNPELRDREAARNLAEAQAFDSGRLHAERSRFIAALRRQVPQ